MIALIDTHCHLDAPEFAADRLEVLHRAQAAGIYAQILPAVTRASWPQLAQLCADQSGLFAAFGLHPLFLDQHQDADLQALESWLRDAEPVAVGECGLDFFVEGLDRLRQQRFFETQLELALGFDLPLILHARRAVEAVILSLKRMRPLRGVVHSYAGSAEQARELQRLGFKLGLGGPLTYPRARRLRELAVTLPLPQLLLETDAPDQPLCGFQGQRNEPVRCVEVLETLARLRGIDAAELAGQLNANAIELFGARLNPG